MLQFTFFPFGVINKLYNPFTKRKICTYAEDTPATLYFRDFYDQQRVFSNKFGGVNLFFSFILIFQW